MTKPARAPRLTVVSGGQTGADRGALDAALALGLPCGGWCPRRRRAEDGAIPAVYPLKEAPSEAYPQRTEWNVRDSDATLVLHAGHSDRGTVLTATIARRLRRPFLVLDVTSEPAGANAEAVQAWLGSHSVRVLNVAGPRESSAPGLQNRVRVFLEQALQAFAR